MDKWAKVHLIEKLSKGKIKDVLLTDIVGVYMEPVRVGTTEGYYIYIVRPLSEITEKLWFNIENELLKYGIMYTAFEDKSISYPFNVVQEVTGVEVKMLLAPTLARYIFKYKLVKDSFEKAPVGIIAGKINTTIEILRELSKEAYNLILFVRNPKIYEGIIEDMNKQIDGNIELMYPNARTFQKMQVIFDVNLYNSYVNLCDMRTIYIDLNKNTDNRFTSKNNQKRPIIWQDFEVLFSRKSIDLDVLQLAYYSMGFTKSTLTRQVRKYNAEITRVYKFETS